MPIRARLTAGALLLALSTSALALDSRAEAFVTAAGHRIELTPAEEMDCTELHEKIIEIDSTDYRGRRPEPRDARDAQLLVYETRVSRRYYTRCARAGAQRDASEVLRGGFSTSVTRAD